MSRDLLDEALRRISADMARSPDWREFEPVPLGLAAEIGIFNILRIPLIGRAQLRALRAAFKAKGLPEKLEPVKVAPRHLTDGEIRTIRKNNKRADRLASEYGLWEHLLYCIRNDRQWHNPKPGRIVVRANVPDANGYGTWIEVPEDAVQGVERHGFMPT